MCLSAKTGCEQNAILTLNQVRLTHKLLPALQPIYELQVSLSKIMVPLLYSSQVLQKSGTIAFSSNNVAAVCPQDTCLPERLCSLPEVVQYDLYYSLIRVDINNKFLNKNKKITIFGIKIVFSFESSFINLSKKLFQNFFHLEVEILQLVI